MVLIERRLDIISRINESPILITFNNLLLGDSISMPNTTDLNEIDRIYYNTLIAFQTNNKSLFEEYYNIKRKSNPNKESPPPFVNNDFFIFSLLIGIIKFNIDKTWMQNVLSIRNRTPITITFENILNEDYISKSNLKEIILIYLYLNKNENLTNELLTDTFQHISNNTEQIFNDKNDFYTLCSLRAYDLIIKQKEYSHLLFLFQKKFLHRIKYLSWIVQTGIFVILLLGVVQLISIVPSINNFFNKFDPIFGVLGFSIVGNFIAPFSKFTYRIIAQLLGYPKELLNKKEAK
jgi:hypothetical protein